MIDSRCFDVRYRSNEVGARDTQFEHAKSDGKIRYVLIGDSFAEGYGVEFEDTAQAQLEKLLDINIYNFGCDGHFGPAQYYLMYKNIARQFQPRQMTSQTTITHCGRTHPFWYRPIPKRSTSPVSDIDTIAMGGLNA